MAIIYVALGSAFGGVARYFVSKIITAQAAGMFPWGTFVVNVVGCFIIGLVYGFLDRGGVMSENTRLFLTVGFCGGFTTFSTFAYESAELLKNGHTGIAFAYVVSSIVLGVAAIFAAQLLFK